MEPVVNDELDFPAQPPESNMCGAYALAYWSAMSQLPMSAADIEAMAKDYYGKICFKEDDFLHPGFCNEDRLKKYSSNKAYVKTIMDQVASICLANGGYCNPKKMMERIMGRIMKNADCSFYLGSDPMIWAVYVKLKEIEPEIASRIYGNPFDPGQEMLEVVGSGNGLHYLYTFMEGGIRRAIDPADGFHGEKKGVPDRRTVIAKYGYRETGAAIVIDRYRLKGHRGSWTNA